MEMTGGSLLREAVVRRKQCSSTSGLAGPGSVMVLKPEVSGYSMNTCISAERENVLLSGNKTESFGLKPGFKFWLYHPGTNLLE